MNDVNNLSARAPNFNPTFHEHFKTGRVATMATSAQLRLSLLGQVSIGNEFVWDESTEARRRRNPIKNLK